MYEDKIMSDMSLSDIADCILLRINVRLYTYRVRVWKTWLACMVALKRLRRRIRGAIFENFRKIRLWLIMVPIVPGSQNSVILYPKYTLFFIRIKIIRISG